jgi:signal transduction histidine kinase
VLGWSEHCVAVQAMAQAAAAGRQSLDEMRRLLQVLRADGVEPPAQKVPQPGLDALDALLADVRQTGLTVNLVRSGDSDRPSAAVQTTMYRIVQEALTNVLKHAESASTVTVVLEFGATEIRFEVENDSLTPVVVFTSGNGLIGMRERVTVFGGSISSGPSSTGWFVRGRLPIA